MPNHKSIGPVRNVFDLVVPAVVGLRKIRRWADDQVTSHLRMDIAQHRHCTRLVEGEGTLLAFRPGPEVVSSLLVPADCSPKDVLGSVFAVLEVHGRTLLHHDDVRRKHQTFLIDYWVLLWSGESLARNGVDV